MHYRRYLQFVVNMHAWIMIFKQKARTVSRISNLDWIDRYFKTQWEHMECNMNELLAKRRERFSMFRMPRFLVANLFGNQQLFRVKYNAQRRAIVALIRKREARKRSLVKKHIERVFMQQNFMLATWAARVWSAEAKRITNKIKRTKAFVKQSERFFLRHTQRIGKESLLYVRSEIVRVAHFLEIMYSFEAHNKQRVRGETMKVIMDEVRKRVLLRGAILNFEAMERKYMKERAMRVWHSEAKRISDKIRRTFEFEERCAEWIHRHNQRVGRESLAYIRKEILSKHRPTTT